MSEKILTNSELAQEACAWIAQLESESMKSDDKTAFREWVGRSPAHKSEIRRYAQFSQELNLLTEMRRPLKEAADEHRQLSVNLNKGWARNFSYAFTVMFALTAMLLGTQYLVPSDDSIDGPVLYKTAVGSYSKIKLADGTLLELNTNSEVEVDYSPTRRKVRLLSGEAFFQVAHNKNRPFVVYAGEKSVRAVGTAFAVSLLPTSFEVTVTEGKVELLDNSAVREQSEDELVEVGQVKQAAERLVTPIYLSAGETLEIDPQLPTALKTDSVGSVSQREILRQLSWQDGLLDFSETPLVEVIEDLSRYTTMKIEIQDPELRNLKFGGLFRTNELQALFDALELTFDIRIEKINDQHVRLSRIAHINS